MRLERVSWVKVEEYFQKNDTVILAVGSTECHGRHAALGTDTLIPNKILELIENQSDTMILPTLPYGDCDWHLDYPGSISIGSDLLQETVTRIFTSLYEWGAKRFVILNGHGGNTAALENACRKLDDMGAVCAVINWWSMVWDLNPDWKGGHGGAEETSALLAISPDLVDTTEYQDMGLLHPTPNIHPIGLRGVEYKGVKVIIPRGTRKVVTSGWYGTDHPKNSSKEWGEEMLQAAADYIVDFIGEFQKIPLDID